MKLRTHTAAGLLAGLWTIFSACSPMLASPPARLQAQPAPYVATGI